MLSLQQYQQYMVRNGCMNRDKDGKKRKPGKISLPGTVSQRQCPFQNKEKEQGAGNPRRMPCWGWIDLGPCSRDVQAKLPSFPSSEICNNWSEEGGLRDEFSIQAPLSPVSWDLPAICADGYPSSDREEVTLNIHKTRSNQWIKKLRLFYLRLKKQQQSNNQTKPTQNNNT